MTEDIQNIVTSIPTNDINEFLSKTESTVVVKKDTEKTTVDFSWVEKVHEAIPYLDNIIRNPRRFIVQEEDIVPIEKTKKVTEESIKHLAQHTSLIQEIDKEGVVKPLKLLNIYKEETIDLYENRFIYSLISNLYVFLQNQLVYKDEESSSKEVRTVNYEATTKFKNEDITVSLSLKALNYETLTGSGENMEELKTKLEHIRDVLDDFKSSQFMKAMMNATPVRSPIRKTNVILKDQNFIIALRLWEFLESFQIEAPIKKYKESLDLASPAVDKKYSLTYFINYCLLNGLTEDNKVDEKSKFAILKKLVFDAGKNFDNDENELRRILNNELKLATKYKQDQIRGINEAYKAFISNHLNRIERAELLLK